MRMNTVTVTINGKTFEADSNHTILHAAGKNGIAIPTLCYLEDVNYTGSCRLCMVDGLNGLGHNAVSSGNYKDGSVHLGGSSNHVLDVVGVARAVDVSVVALV